MTLRFCILAAAFIAISVAGCANHGSPSSRPPAVSEFDAAKDPPISARTHFAAGQLAETQGRFDAAADQYRRAVAREPKYQEATYRLGVVYAELKDYPRAIDTWNKYVALTDGSAAAFSNLGFCQELAGNPAAAEISYKKGIARDANSEPCRINYGLMLARRGRANQGLEQLQVVLTPAQAHYDLASVYEQQGRRQEARAEYQKSLQLDPQFDEAKAKLAALN